MDGRANPCEGGSSSMKAKSRSLEDFLDTPYTRFSLIVTFSF